MQDQSQTVTLNITPTALEFVFVENKKINNKKHKLINKN